MRIQKRDAWVKARSKPLTRDEIEFIRQGFLAGDSYYDVARALQCSSRTAIKYFAIFRKGQTPHTDSKPTMQSKPVPAVCLPSQIPGSFIAPPSKERLMAGR